MVPDTSTLTIISWTERRGREDREDPLCCRCDEGAAEIEIHFRVSKYIKEELLPKFDRKNCAEFLSLAQREKRCGGLAFSYTVKPDKEI